MLQDWHNTACSSKIASNGYHNNKNFCYLLRLPQQHSQCNVNKPFLMSYVAVIGIISIYGMDLGQLVLLYTVWHVGYARLSLNAEHTVNAIHKKCNQLSIHRFYITQIVMIL